VLSGFLAAIVGGAGMLTLPALMLVGLSPQMALATTKFASVGFWISTLFKFNKAGRVAWSLVIPLCAIGALGSVVGSWVVVDLPEKTLKIFVVIVILLVLPLVLKKDLGVSRPEKITKGRKLIGYTAYGLVSIYFGFLGVGGGILTSLIYVSFFGLTYTEGRATDGPARILMALASLLVFASAELVNIWFGITLMLGMMAGGWWGAHTAINKGNLWVQRVFVVTTVMMIVHLLWDILSAQ